MPGQRVRIPNQIDSTLFLIGEELKSRKLFHALHQVGIDDCYFQPSLDKLILQYVGMDDHRNETFAVYNAIMDKRSKKIEADRDSIAKQAFKAYMDLVQEVKKQTKKSK